ncbi:MAG: YdcF family protein [Clostridia bacterium]|nr:YdcF family protein [Clostridia bacterium]
MSAFFSSHPTLRFFFILACALVLLFILALAALVIAEKTVPAPAADCRYVLVLGAQVYETGEPSKQLLARIETAYGWWLSHPDAIIIGCGGQGNNEPRAEGDVIRDRLIALGVPEPQVFSESSSVNTRDNIAKARQFMDGAESGVIIVTSDYHLPRALAVAGNAGLKASGLPAPTLPEWWIKNHFREVLAWGKYFLLKIF